MSKIINTLFVCILGITQSGNVHSQTNDELKALKDSLLEINAYSNEVASFVPNVILPSPETVALFRSIDYSLNNSNGVIPIEIPLYTIQCGPITLPITLTYSTTGRKVSDVTGAVGLGWSLNTGGMVSRTIYGCPDETYHFPTGLKKANEYNLRNFADYDFLATLVHFDRSSPNYPNHYLDTEYDIFSYSVGSHSGSFVLKENQPVMLNAASPVRINTGGAYTTSITDENGTTYLFDNPEYTTSIFKGSIGQLTDFSTGTSLTKVTSCDEKQVINFTYSTYKYNQAPSTYNYLSITENTLEDRREGGDMDRATIQNRYDRVINASTVYSIYKVNRISTISFPGGTITFTQDNSDKKITQMKVKDTQGNQIKVIDFAYLMLETGIYALKTLTINNVEKYDFEYFPSQETTLFGKDYWGYKNNRGYFGITIPSITLEDDKNTQIFGGTNNRLPNLGTTQDGILNKIIYPTGGWTQYYYELNQYNLRGIKSGGGLRVSQIRSADEEGNLIIKSYEYSNNGCGTYMVYPEDACRPSDDVFVEYYAPGQTYYGHYRRRSFNFEFNDDVSYLANAGIHYTVITEYTHNVSKGEFGKTEYYYDNPYEADATAEYPSRGTVSPVKDGKIFVSQFNSFWRKANLWIRKTYKKNGSTYELQAEIENKYDKTQIDRLYGLKIFTSAEFYNESSYGLEKEGANAGYEVFRFADYYISIGKEQLTSSVETNYFPGGNVKKQTNYYYNDKGLLKKNVESFGNETVTKEWTYYYENENEMKSLNLLSSFKDYTVNYQNGTASGNVIDSNTYTYQKWGEKAWAPSKIYTFSSGKDTPYVTYHKYDDYGNPLWITDINSEDVIYVWGYNKQYLVAEIRNLPYATVDAALNMNSFSSAVVPDYSKIDKLRKDYPKAYVKSYTYKPLVGITSVTDVNGLKTTYEYDAESRLKAIKDHEGAVMQEFIYHFRR